MEKLSTIGVPEFREVVERFSPFFHEVKRRIAVTAIFFVLSSILGFLFYEKIIKLLIGIISLSGVNIVFTSPFQFINLAISCGVASGVILSFPLILFQIISFLKPALRKKEYNLIVRLIPFAVILFIIGFVFGAIVMKWQIEIFSAQSVSLGIGNILDISKLISTVVWTAALMGVLFEFPILLLVLLRIGILKRQLFTKNRLYVYLISFIVAILLPPDSILADVLLSLPLIFLFEVTLVIDKLNRRKS